MQGPVHIDLCEFKKSRSPTRPAALPVAKDIFLNNCRLWGSCPINFINFVRSVCNDRCFTRPCLKGRARETCRMQGRA